jgi:CBS domain-containing protein
MHMLARDIMTRTILSVTPDHSIRHAARMMLDHNVSGLLVIDGSDRLVGVLSEGDLLRRFELGPAAIRSEGRQSAEDYLKTHGWRVGDTMTSPVVTISETTPIDRIAALLSAKRIKRVPVVSDGKVAGIVSRADIMRGIVASPPDDSAGSDEAIRLAIATRLQHELHLDPARIDVTVSNGDARLTGQVRSIAEQKAAYLVAETVGGVRGIVNNLKVATDKPDVVDFAIQ